MFNFPLKTFRSWESILTFFITSISLVIFLIYKAGEIAEKHCIMDKITEAVNKMAKDVAERKVFMDSIKNNKINVFDFEKDKVSH